jgi:hypothetical protein
VEVTGLSTGSNITHRDAVLQTSVILVIADFDAWYLLAVLRCHVSVNTVTELSPCIRILIDMLISAQLIKKYPALYGF